MKNLVKLSTYRVYYRSEQVPDGFADVYTDAPTAQAAVDDICATDPTAEVLDVAKIVTGWKQKKGIEHYDN